MKYNPQQVEVINHGTGPCLVTAVPGSGKTACLTERIRRLVDSGVMPNKILAVTFTNKAANEMKSRLVKKLGRGSASRITACTIHSLCARLIRMFHEDLGLPKDYVIYDSSDQEAAIKSCLCDVLNLNKRSEVDSKDYYLILDYLETTRNSLRSDEDRSMMAERWMYKAVEKYYQKLSTENALDFTGLLSKTFELFRMEHSPALDYCHRRWEYISVDEVQDTNVIQYEMLKLMADKSRNVIFVGDYQQSIYRFRGAHPKNILRFEQEFGAKVLKVEKNYRSSPNILFCAHKLIKKNTSRKDIKLFTDNIDGPQPDIIQGGDDLEMAEFIADFVSRRISRGVPPAEIAIFYRVNAASRVLERVFRLARIPYKVIGGFSFWNRREIKAGVGILRMMANPNDRIAFDRVADMCLKGVGPKTVNKIMSGTNIMEAAKGLCGGNSKASVSIRALLEGLDSATKLSPGKGMIAVAEQVGFWSGIGADKEKGGVDRQENMRELASDVDYYVSNKKDASISRYLQEISLISSMDINQEMGKVNLMTLHAAKGLEFDVVVISHANQGMIPHKMSLEADPPEEAQEQLEEERRLMYVGMTRARKWLRIACCRSRFGKPQMPSQFIAEAGLF